VRANLLVLGGSRFVGRALVEAAVDRRWAVTSANLGGWTHPAARQITLDRLSPGALKPLIDQPWDAILDTWAGDVGVVAATVEELASRVVHYTYISTMSGYRPNNGPITESTPVLSSGELTGYAANKRRAEEVLAATDGLMLHIVRPGVILGPYEYPGRLAWWLERLIRRRAVLVPGPKDRPIQFVDARDLAGFALDSAGKGTQGVTNVASPRDSLTTAEFVNACRSITGSSAELIWIDETWLRSAGAVPWTGVPLWVDELMSPNIYDVDVSLACRRGAQFRDPTETIADTLSWLERGGCEEIESRSWMNDATEDRIIDSWLSGQVQPGANLRP
jgi:2'-hydroxyisoflavone reductase